MCTWEIGGKGSKETKFSFFFFKLFLPVLGSHTASGQASGGWSSSQQAIGGEEQNAHQRNNHLTMRKSFCCYIQFLGDLLYTKLP